MPTFSDNLLPNATGQDLGSSGQRWDAFLQTVDATGNATVGGDLTVTGNISSSGSLSSNLTGNVTGNLTGNVTGNLNGTVGGVTPAAGAFTTLTASSTAAVTGNATFGGTLGVTGASTFTGLLTANGGVAGNINGSVGASTPSTGVFTSLTCGTNRTTFSTNGLATKYNNIALAGNGFPAIRASAEATAQSAAITTQNLVASLPAGVYKVSYCLQITQAATTSSAAQLTIGWNNGYAAQTKTSTNLTGNTLTTSDYGSIILHTISSAALTYAVSYTSVGATSMQYAIAIRVETL